MTGAETIGMERTSPGSAVAARLSPHFSTTTRVQRRCSVCGCLTRVQRRCYASRYLRSRRAQMPSQSAVRYCSVRGCLSPTVQMPGDACDSADAGSFTDTFADPWMPASGRASTTLVLPPQFFPPARRTRAFSYIAYICTRARRTRRTCECICSSSISS